MKNNIEYDTMFEDLDQNNYDTDKWQSKHYIENYHQYFSSLKDNDISLFELGIHKGGSLLLWRDYFTNGSITGLDMNPVEISDETGRIHVYTGQQHDTALLDRIAGERASNGFDIIIDDCSHIGSFTRITFWHLFDNHLKPGGIYAIEDWGTGYWDQWIDGKNYAPPEEDKSELTVEKLQNQRFPSHDYGMVGFVKELIDECAMGDITFPDRGISPRRSSKFKSMKITHGHVIIVKA